MKKYAILYVAIILLSACAQLGLPQAETFSQKLAVGYGTVTQIRQTATALLNANKLSAEDGQNVLKSTDVAREGLDVAKNLAKTDLKTAEGKLTAIRSTLTALQGYLTTRGN